MATPPLLTSSNTGNFDQVFAFSQQLINDSLVLMYNKAAADSPIKTWNKKVGSVGELKDGKLGPPKIDVLVEDNSDLSSIRYYLQLTSGTLTLSTSSDSDDTHDFIIPSSGWTFAFRVNISHSDVPKDSQEFKDLSAAVNSGLKAYDFSLTKLWLESSNASYANPQDGKYDVTDIDWSKWPEETKDNYDTFMTKWLRGAAKAGQTLLGYTVNPTDPTQVDNHVPTFIPSTLNRQTYPYHPIKDGNSKNTILYLVTTDKHPIPSPATIAVGDGEFVEDDGPKGTFMMHNRQFWNTWLSPLMQELNKRTEVYIGSPSAKAYTKDGCDIVEADIDDRVGDNPDHPNLSDQYFAFTRQEPASKEDNASYKWASKEYDESCSVTANLGIDITNKSQSQTTMTISPGGSLININGGTIDEAWFTLTGSDLGSDKATCYFKITITWTLPTKITPVNDGGIQLEIAKSTGDDKYYTVTVDPNKDIPDYMETNWDSWVQSFRDGMDACFENLANVEASLIESLRYQHLLQLPAAGTIAFTGGTFNRNADFLAGVEWIDPLAPSAASSKQQRPPRSRVPITKLAVQPSPPVKSSRRITINLTKMQRALAAA